MGLPAIEHEIKKRARGMTTMAKKPKQNHQDSLSTREAVPVGDLSWLKVLTICATMVFSVGGAVTFVDRVWERQFVQLSEALKDIKTDVRDVKASVDKLETKTDSNFNTLNSKIDENQKELIRVMTRK